MKTKWTVITVTVAFAASLSTAMTAPAPKATTDRNMSLIQKVEGSCKKGYCKQFSKRGNYLICAPC